MRRHWARSWWRTQGEHGGRETKMNTSYYRLTRANMESQKQDIMDGKQNKMEE